MSDIQITTADGRTALATPYHAGLVARARDLGGRWDRTRSVWTFDARDEGRVRDLAREFFGTDGSEPAGDVVTVRIRAADHECDRWNDGPFAEFAGRRVAERPSRDARVRLAANVVLVDGEFDRSSGSMKNPGLGGGTAVLEIRDLPRAALDREKADSYEILTPPAPAEEPAVTDLDALLAEREQLLARLAEIDARLPEPEGAEASTRDAAVALGVSVRTVQRWAATGKVDARKDDRGRWVITITVGR
jgi:hypothetical protein